jgi:hypothetical protein
MTPYLDNKTVNNKNFLYNIIHSLPYLFYFFSLYKIHKKFFFILTVFFFVVKIILKFLGKEFSITE